jgi:hypothetical protein
MDRKWTYRDDSGVEYGPYTREELLIYSEQSRISRTGRIRESGGEWINTMDLLPFPEENASEFEEAATPPRPPESPNAPPTERDQAEKISGGFQQNNRSVHPRILYILLGIILPLTVCGLSGVNNLWVGRTGIGVIQLGLSLSAIILNTTGIILGFTICVGLPLWAGIVLWSILEAATNEYDGKGRLMR